MLEDWPAVSFPRSQVRDTAGLVSTGPRPPRLAARSVAGDSKAQLACQLQSILPPQQASLDLHCPHVPESRRPVRVPVWYVRPWSPLILPSFHL